MEIKLKNVKVTQESWRSVKVFAAMHDCNIRAFVEEAIREKIQRESLKIETEPKEKQESAPEHSSEPEKNEFAELIIFKKQSA
jgi:hypothetical protein